jgi:hypothetical protein
MEANQVGKPLKDDIIEAGLKFINKVGKEL